MVSHACLLRSLASDPVRLFVCLLQTHGLHLKDLPAHDMATDVSFFLLADRDQVGCRGANLSSQLGAETQQAGYRRMSRYPQQGALWDGSSDSQFGAVRITAMP